MSDFDLSLIREFRSRPAFYDRNSPLFKDKAFNGQAWQEISNILGYDVALLKDRMLQLRNRYNLEKRRLEQLAEENPGKQVNSPWPLYEHLGFLSDHIRSRRSFKRMLPRHSSMEVNMSGYGGGVGGGGSSTNMSPQQGISADCSETNASTNGFLTVKLENPPEMETDSQSGTDIGAGDENNIIANVRHLAEQSIEDTTVNVSQHISKSISQTSTIPTLPTIQKSISIRNLDSMRTSAAHINNNNSRKNNHHTNHFKIDPYANRSRHIRSEAIAVIPEKKRFLTPREQKYEAFGQFVASSLGEMPKQEALLLVENFTKEVVRVLIEKNNNNSCSLTNLQTSSSCRSGVVNNCSNSCNSMSQQKDAILQVSAQQQQRQAN